MSYLTENASERLRYRPLTEDDILVWTQFMEDPESTKFFSNLKGTPKENATYWINKQLQRYRENSFGLYAIISKETGEFIGQCGLLKKTVDGKEEVEVGYSLLKRHTGKGYAIEAARHMKEFGLKNQLADSIISIIHVDNLPSQAVAMKNGMKEDKRTIDHEVPVIIFRTKS